MKIGISFKIDVTKLDKNRFFKGAKGTYCDLTAFIDTENVSQYGDNGSISQATTKEERDGGTKIPICGNVKVFYKSESNQGHIPPVASRQDTYQQPAQGQQPGAGGYDDTIPF